MEKSEYRIAAVDTAMQEKCQTSEEHDDEKRCFHVIRFFPGSANFFAACYSKFTTYAVPKAVQGH
jgi:hypothetical protein